MWNRSLNRRVLQRTLELTESENRFRVAFEQAAVGIAHVSNEGKFLRINSKFCEIVGYSQSEMLAFTFQEITHPEDLEADEEQVNLMLAGKKQTYAVEKRYFHKSGRIVWVRLTVSMVREKQGKFSYFVSVIEDITLRKHTEDKLKESEEKYRALVEQAQDGICIVQDGKIKFVNPYLAYLLGYNLDELLNTSITSHIAPEDLPKAIDLYQRRMKNESVPSIYESSIVNKKGAILEVEFNVKLTTYLSKPADLVMVRDISERKKAEKQIIKYQQRLKALASELTISEEKQRKQISNDLHDHVGQLLASSRMQLSLMNDSMDKGDILQKNKDISQGLLKGIQAIRTTIFDLSPPQLNEIGLFAATSDWLEEQIELKHGITATVTGDDQVFPLEENVRFLLFRSIRELLMNAVKHAKASMVEVVIKKYKDSLLITVQDDGIGFSFFPGMLRLKDQRFGLFSIQERMTDNGGSLDIESAPGKGTKVKIIIPLSK